MSFPIESIWDRIGCAVRAAVEYLYPPVCVSCRKNAPCGKRTADLKAERDPDSALRHCLCADCMSDFLVSRERRCILCGKSYAECECVPDMLADAGIRRAYSCFCYDKRKRGAAERLIYAVKSTENRDAINFAAHLLAARIRAVLTERGADLSEYMITYAPRRKSAVRRHGDDHMRLTAKLVSKLTGAEFVTLFISSATGAQKERGAAERLEAAEKAYSLKNGAADKIKDSKMIIIDDIITSGATMAACAALSYAAEASEVLLFSLAKTTQTHN